MWLPPPYLLPLAVIICAPEWVKMNMKLAFVHPIH
jgi:hypothetical protein